MEQMEQDVKIVRLRLRPEVLSWVVNTWKFQLGVARKNGFLDTVKVCDGPDGLDGALAEMERVLTAPAPTAQEKEWMQMARAYFNRENDVEVEDDAEVAMGNFGFSVDARVYVLASDLDVPVCEDCYRIAQKPADESEVADWDCPTCQARWAGEEEQDEEEATTATEEV